MTRPSSSIRRIPSGVPNFDHVLGGGIPRGSAMLLAGAPGSGKTILAQQICFHNATPDAPALLFHTLSEPTAKTLLYLSQFDHFDPAKMNTAVRYVDLGVILRKDGLADSLKMVMDHVKREKPAIVVIDSFKVFDELAENSEDRRKFIYELLVNLLAWECTTLLLGEYPESAIMDSALFSISDGLVRMGQHEFAGNMSRWIQVVKLRGTPHDRERHPFRITSAGVELLQRAPADAKEPGVAGDIVRTRTRLSKLDDLLGEGIPRGASLLVSGSSGTGKTVLMLELLHAAAKHFGEKGLYLSFEETPAQLRAIAAGLGFDLESAIAKGLIEIAYTSQDQLRFDEQLEMIRRKVDAFRPSRVALDSLSMLVHKVEDPRIVRDQIFRLTRMFRESGAISFLGTDVIYGSDRISRHGVEETIADGVIVLTAQEEEVERQRYIEIYKLRNTAHLRGRHGMVIAHGGMRIYPRYVEERPLDAPTATLEPRRRIGSGVPGFDALIGGGLPENSVTLISGSAGSGKTTFAVQFALEGARAGEQALYVTLEEGVHQIRRAAEALKLPVDRAIERGDLELVYLTREEVRSALLFWNLKDRLVGGKVKRLVVDCISHLYNQGMQETEVRKLLYNLFLLTKELGVTSVFTLNARETYSFDAVTENEISPVSDNLVLLRYARTADELRPTVTIVKARGSDHSRRTHPVTVAEGGMRIAGAAMKAASQAKKASKPPKPPKKKKK